MKSRIEVLTLEKPRLNLRDAFSSIGAFFGITLAILGVLMMITIILFIPGIGLFLAGTTLAYGSLPRKKSDCPVCSLELKAKLNAKNTKCQHCETIVPIKWIKARKRKKKKPSAE